MEHPRSRFGAYIVIGLPDKPESDTDLLEVEREVEWVLKSGHKHIALSYLFIEYPYSRFMSLLSRCVRLCKKYRAQLAVIVPDVDFIETLTDTGFAKVLTIVTSPADLKSQS